MVTLILISSGYNSYAIADSFDDIAAITVAPVVCGLTINDAKLNTLVNTTSNNSDGKFFEKLGIGLKKTPTVESSEVDKKTFCSRVSKNLSEFFIK